MLSLTCHRTLSKPWGHPDLRGLNLSMIRLLYKSKENWGPTPQKNTHTQNQTHRFKELRGFLSPPSPSPRPQTQHTGRAEGLHSELKRPARSQIPGSRILIFQASGGQVSRRVWLPPGPTPIPAAGLPAAPAVRPPAAGSQRGAPRPGPHCRALFLSLSPRPQGVAPWPFAAACTLPPAGSP